MQARHYKVNFGRAARLSGFADLSDYRFKELLNKEYVTTYIGEEAAGEDRRVMGLDTMMIYRLKRDQASVCGIEHFRSSDVIHYMLLQMARGFDADGNIEPFLSLLVEKRKQLLKRGQQTQNELDIVWHDYILKKPVTFVFGDKPDATLGGSIEKFTRGNRHVWSFINMAGNACELASRKELKGVNLKGLLLDRGCYPLPLRSAVRRSATNLGGNAGAVSDRHPY